MTINIQQINTATDSFGQWISKSNQSFAAFSSVAVTTNSNTTVGNAAITGTFTANTLYATSNGFFGNTAANISLITQFITIQDGPTTNNIISANGMLISTTGYPATIYYRDIMSMGNTTIRGANVTSNGGFFDNLRVGNTTNVFFSANSLGCEAYKVNTNILYVRGPGAFASVGTNESNVYITKDGLEVYANPTGSLVQNSKLTSTDLYVENIHANTMSIRHGRFDDIGTINTPWLTMISNTMFNANTQFNGANNQFRTGLASNASIDLVGPNIQFSHRYYDFGTTLNANVASLYNENNGGAFFARNWYGNNAAYYATSSQGEGVRLGEGKIGFWNFYTGVPAGTFTGNDVFAYVSNTSSAFSSNVFIGYTANSSFYPEANTTLVVNGAVRFLTAQGGGSVSLRANNTPWSSMLSVELILPANTGAPGQVMFSDGTGKLGFKDEYRLTASDYLRIQGLGVGVAYNPNGPGEIRAGGNITAYYSDKRLKENIQVIENSLEKINKLKGITFNNNELAIQLGYVDNDRQVGVLAQDVLEVLPEAVKLAPFDTEFKGDKPVSKSGENYLTVQYDRLIPLLIEAIKELKNEIDSLKANR